MPVYRRTHRHLRQTWITPCNIDARQPCQLEPSPAKGLAVAIEQADAQRLRHARACVVDAAVAAAEQNALGAGVEGRKNQLPYAKAGRRCGVAVLERNQPEAGRRGHLDHGRKRTASAEHSEKTFDRMPKRPRHAYAMQVPAGQCNQTLREPFAAVEDRGREYPRFRRRARNAPRHGLGSHCRRNRLLESRRSDEDRKPTARTGARHVGTFHRESPTCGHHQSAVSSRMAKNTGCRTRLKVSKSLGT